MINSNKIYNGKPCKNCKETTKWRSSQSCVSCTRSRVKNRSPEVGTKWLTSDKGKKKRRKFLKKYIKTGMKSHIQRRHKYGIEPDQYGSMLSEQKNKCAICKSDDKLGVDHCHKTGKVRGLLCKKCNFGLGMFSDNVEVLNDAIKYLEKV